jgi:predicted regulator of Ras-like GTPase activity (Roadblock/LC7/MglB family)
VGRHQTTVSEIGPESIVQQFTLDIGEENRVFKKLRPVLSEIRKNDKIRGFILKNSARAIADLDKPGEITELATFASQLLIESEKLLSACNGEHTKSVVMEGPKMKTLCVNIGGNQISIFMDNSADYKRILEKLNSTK